MPNLPITNIINVTVTDTPSGLTEKNVNSLALFTNESPSNMNPFGIYISASQVAADYGTSSVTAKMANAVFSQSPNVLSGNGRLVIIPLQSSVSATAGKVVTADISANLSNLVAVTGGGLGVTIDGTLITINSLDLSKAVTLADVAAILQTKLDNVVVTASATAITMTSKKCGTASTVTISAAGSGTDLAGTGYLHSATSTASAGVNSTGEALLDAIARTQAAVGYAGVITNLELEDTEIAEIAAGIQAQDLIFVHHVSSTGDIAGIGTTVSAAGETKTRLVLYTAGLVAANLMKAAYAGRAFSVNFDGSNTSQTLNLKSLVTINPDAGISQTIYTAAGVAGVDLYVSYDGVASIFSTGGNDYFDNPYTDLALKFKLQTAGFNFLRQTNTKVPQTESGMNGLKDAYEQVMEQFVNNGAIAPGSWTSPETFGNPEILKNNILTRGYYVYSLPIYLQDTASRAQRKAPLVQMAVKRSGALHTSDVLVVVNA